MNELDRAIDVLLKHAAKQPAATVKSYGEPWRAPTDDEEDELRRAADVRMVAVDRDGNLVMPYHYTDRIVACVNACAGINPAMVPLLLAELIRVRDGTYCQATHADLNGDVCGVTFTCGGCRRRAELTKLIDSVTKGA